MSKFLSFAGPTLDTKKLYDVQILDKYLKMLESGGRKATTQHSILCRVKQGLTYVNLSLDPVETLKAEKCLKLNSNWLSTTLGKEARRTKRANLEDLSDKGAASMSEIERFAHSSDMKSFLHQTVKRAKKKERVTQRDIRRNMIWLAGSILHYNAQQPGAIGNATLSEYRGASVSTIGRETYKTFLVDNHKTGTTGRAKLTMNRHLTQCTDLFVTHLRPHLEGSSSQLLFPNREGNPLDHLSRHIETLATKLGFHLPRTVSKPGMPLPLRLLEVVMLKELLWQLQCPIQSGLSSCTTALRKEKKMLWRDTG